MLKLRLKMKIKIGKSNNYVYIKLFGGDFIFTISLCLFVKMSM